MGGYYPSLFTYSPGELFGMSPFALMRRMSDEMDRVFRRYSGESGEEGVSRGSWWPALEVTEKDGNLNVCAELPGLKPEDVKVEVDENRLIIHGERRREQEGREGGQYRSERSYGSFYRSVPLPEGAAVDKAKAEYTNGELRITIPVPQSESRRREIPIQGSSTK
jgi:HSP20 family protein